MDIVNERKNFFLGTTGRRIERGGAATSDVEMGGSIARAPDDVPLRAAVGDMDAKKASHNYSCRYTT